MLFNTKVQQAASEAAAPLVGQFCGGAPGSPAKALLLALPMTLQTSSFVLNYFLPNLFGNVSKIRQSNGWIEGRANGSKCGRGSTVKCYWGSSVVGVRVFSVSLFQCCCMLGNIYINNKMVRTILSSKRAAVFSVSCR